MRESQVSGIYIRSMCRWLLIALLHLMLVPSHAQGNGLPSDTLARLRLYTSPLQLMDVFSRPMATLGVEVRLTPRSAACMEIGTRIMSWDPDTTWVKTAGYSLRLEWKRYLTSLNWKHGHPYMAIEYRGIRDRFNMDIEYRIAVDTLHSMHWDAMSTTLRIDIANVKYGVVMDLGSRFCIDVYTGIGVRSRHIINAHREYLGEPDHEFVATDLNRSIFWLARSDGPQHFQPNLSLGFKIGWRLGR